MFIIKVPTPASKKKKQSFQSKVYIHNLMNRKVVKGTPEI